MGRQMDFAQSGRPTFLDVFGGRARRVRTDQGTLFDALRIEGPDDVRGPPPEVVTPSALDPNDLDAALTRLFGFPCFRPGQREVIEAVLSGRDALAVMATGSGKSLTYLLPAYLLPGVTIVVSPLISLMHDQVQKLRQLGLPAAVLNSQVPWASSTANRSTRAPISAATKRSFRNRSGATNSTRRFPSGRSSSASR